MKEKTREDLGLDESDQYLKRISLDYDLGEMGDFSDIFEEKISEEESKDQIEEIKKKV